MKSEKDNESFEFVQIGESPLNQKYETSDQTIANNSDPKINNLYSHLVELSNFLKTVNTNPELKKSDYTQVLIHTNNVFHDLENMNKIPSPEIGTQSPIIESYKALSYALFLILKNLNNGENQQSKNFENSIGNKSNSLLENSTELINFLAEEYDLPRNMTEKEMISSIKEIKKNESSLFLSPKKKVNNEIELLKNKIEKLENCQKEKEDLFKEKTDALVKMNEVQKNKISKLEKKNQSLQSKLNMAIAEGLNISSSCSSDKIDDINRARLKLLETDIESIKNQYNELKNKKQKLASENQQLINENQKLMEREKQSNLQIMELKNSLLKLKIENDSMHSEQKVYDIKDASIIEIQLKEDENKRLDEALKEISTHMESLCDEVSIQSSKYNDLYELTQKIIIVLNKYDNLLIKKEKEAIKNQALLQEYQNTISSLQNMQVKNEREIKSMNLNEKENENIIDEIKKCLSNKVLPNQMNKTLVNILENKQSTSQKVIKILDFILGQFTNQKEISDVNQGLEQQNERLIEYCSSLLCFLEQLANSSEMQNWIIGSPQNESFRPLLLAQCNKIESFLDQFSTDMNLKHEDFLNFPKLAENIIENQEQLQPREVLLLFQICSTVNDSLRRYALNLNESNHALTNDVRELRHELQQMNRECQYAFDDFHVSKESIYSQTENVMNPKLEQIMNLIQNNTEEEDVIIEKIFNILGDNSKKSKEISQIKLLKKENKKLRKENNHLIQEKEDNDLIMQSIQSENIELKKNDKISQIQINQLKEMINIQKMKFEEKSNLISCQKDNSDQIDKLTEEIKKSNDKCLLLEKEKNDQKSILKADFSKKLEKLQKENEELHLQNEEFKNNYTQKFDEIQEKANESNELIKRLKDELENEKLKLKQLTSEYQNLQVENKMLNVKIMTSDEKIQREKNLLETHFKMEKLNIETKNETRIEEIKADYDKQFHDFLVSICERFKEFFDFNQQITDETVQSLLNSLEKCIKHKNEKMSILELYLEEMRSVRSILGLIESEPIVPIISKMVKRLNKLNNLKNEKEIIEKKIVTPPNSNESNANEWETWAKKIILIVSDNFAPIQTSKNLRSSLEEIIMAGISQRSLIKKIDILRSEKILLVNKRIKTKAKNKRISLNSLILIFACIRRLQINSCHLPSIISKPNSKNQVQYNDENANNNINVSNKNYPLIPQKD